MPIPSGITMRVLVKQSRRITTDFDKKRTQNYKFSETLTIKEFEKKISSFTKNVIIFVTDPFINLCFVGNIHNQK